MSGKNQRVLVFLFFLLSCSAYSGMPLFHLYFAEKWLESIGECDEEVKTFFFVGAVFPDIRYFAHLSRSQTHQEGVTLHDLQNASHPFAAGMAFHSFIDEMREKIVVKSGIYEHIKEWGEGHDTIFLKFLEDEIIYRFYDETWYACYFCCPVQQEYEQGIAEEILSKWRWILRIYLLSRPSSLLYYLSCINYSAFDLPVETMRRWSEVLPKLTQDPLFLRYVQDLLQEMEQIF